MKEAHMYAHTEPQREIMHLLIMGGVRRDRVAYECIYVLRRDL